MLKNTKIIALVATLAAWSGVSSAQQTATSTMPTPAPTAAPFKTILSWKSTNDSGRIRELDDSQGRTSKDKQEFSLGLRAPSGWGAYFTAVETAVTYNSEAGNRVNNMNQADHNITIQHPDFMSTTDSKLTGQFRAYFPTSEGSHLVDQRQYAYYLGYEMNLSPKWTLSNTAIPRLFYQNMDSAKLTRSYFEDKTTFTYTFDKNIRFGISQWTQMERHAAPGDGLTVELIPSMDYVFNQHFMVSPRIYLPAYATGFVNGAPRNVSTAEGLVELYLEARL